MPQMFPMNWALLALTPFIMIFTIMNILHFNKKMMSNKNTPLKSSKNYKMLKWMW